MPRPSAETQTIRRIVEAMSDDNLRTQGPSDLMAEVEEAGLSYSAVRDRVNNELARARRIRGIRKGRGRRVAAEDDEDDYDREIMARLLRQYEALDEVREELGFDSWQEFERFAKRLVELIKDFGDAGELLVAIEVKKDAETAKRRSGKPRS
jgi:hypothetical protein